MIVFIFFYNTFFSLRNNSLISIKINMFVLVDIMITRKIKKHRTKRNIQMRI
jgi:hypothetical protein